MRTERSIERGEERLSTEELHALQARLSREASAFPKSVATVADLAEAVGLPPEEVWRHLDQMRAEKAFAVSAPPKRSKWPLLGIAAVLLVAAFVIYKVTPRQPSMAEMDDRIADLKRARANKVSYPIAKTVYLKEKPAPGFMATIQGELTATTYHGAEQLWPGTAAETEGHLREALQKAYDDARKRETEAPKPSTPLKRSPDRLKPQPTADRFVMNVIAAGTGQYTYWMVSTDPALAKSELADTAKRFVLVMQREQDRSLNRSTNELNQVVPPPGFKVQTQVGSYSLTSASPNLAFRPIDPVKVRRRLDLSLRDQIRRTLNPTVPLNGNISSTTPKDQVLVMVAGPLRPIKVSLPLEAGGEHVTAADAMRAYEARITQVLDDAEKQIREINERKE